MKPEDAIQKLRGVIRRKHFSLSTEESYCGWLARFMRYLGDGHAGGLPSERKVEAFLTQLAHQDVSASTQNQAFNALVFFYREALGQPLGDVSALRAKRRETLREAPSSEETRALLTAVKDVHDYPVRLIVHLLYGCGLRVTEPCNLRIKDVDLSGQRLLIHCAKGGKDRVVALPCSLYAGLRDQMEAARVIWKRDASNRIPVALPGLLAKKYPASAFAWKWAWLFPSHTTCAHPRTGETVRWRVHEANVQRAVREACREIGASIKPHELRHAYATHCLNRGSNPRAIQHAMGHKSLQTTMGYLHAEALSVRSPLELLA
ncbi:MAG: integron integrase [Candidatus Hydrogenedentales bacterium]|jgi:integron integrase